MKSIKFNDLRYHGKNFIKLLKEPRDYSPEQLYNAIALLGDIKIILEDLKKKGEDVIDN